MGRRSEDGRALWDDLVSAGREGTAYSPGGLAGLPAPARRLLAALTGPDAVQPTTVVLRMEGRIRLGRWLPFTARQVLSPGHGFLWLARVGRWPLVVTGHDSLMGGHGTLDFRLWGAIPVARAAGPDIDRSTIGRLAAETVVWSPGGLAPSRGAAWRDVDDHRAVVTLPVETERVDVAIDVDDQGRVTDLSLRRWGNPDGGGFGWHSFGASITDWATFDGVTIGTRGTVGWHWDAPDRRATFFEWCVVDASFPHAHQPVDVPSSG